MAKQMNGHLGVKSFPEVKPESMTVTTSAIGISMNGNLKVDTMFAVLYWFNGNRTFHSDLITKIQVKSP